MKFRKKPVVIEAINFYGVLRVELALRAQGHGVVYGHRSAFRSGCVLEAAWDFLLLAKGDQPTVGDHPSVYAQSAEAASDTALSDPPSPVQRGAGRRYAAGVTRGDACRHLGPVTTVQSEECP